MWPRVVELMLGLWIAISPFALRDPNSSDFTMINALACGFVIVAASSMSFWEPTRHARFLTVATGLWMMGRSYLMAPRPAPPSLQNEFLIGMLVTMLAIIPNECLDPPRPWRPFTTPRVRHPKRPISSGMVR